MGIMQYIKEKKIVVSSSRWDLFSLASPINANLKLNPSKLIREDKQYCVAGIYNHDKTKVKVGENIYPYSKDTQSIVIDGEEYYSTRMNKERIYNKTRHISFEFRNKSLGKQSIISDFVIEKAITSPLSRTIMSSYYNLDKASSRRVRSEMCSLATCYGCAKEINNGFHQKLVALSKMEQEKKEQDDFSVHNF